MIRREMYMKRIRPFIGKELIKVITGIRRCGKSTISELIKEELVSSGVSTSQIISIDFEDIRNSHLLTIKELHTYILEQAKNIEGKVYLFFDEIQEVDEWERCVNSLRIKINSDIYITSSDAGLLETDRATYLAGRYIKFEIYPFSFTEFMDSYRLTVPDASENECFQKYLLFGGMPFLSNVNYEEDPSKQYLQDIFDSIQMKDVIRHNRIRDVDLFEKIVRYMIVNTGKPFSATSLKKLLNKEHGTVSTDTVLNYVRYCSDSYLFYRVRRDDLTGRGILTTNEKYYIADHGFRVAITSGQAEDMNLLLENIVYMELLRRKYNVTTGKVKDREIDFVCERYGEKIYVQVTDWLVSEEIIRREFGVYDSIRDNYPKYVVTMDELNFSRNGIIHCNVKDFLLKEEL